MMPKPLALIALAAWSFAILARSAEPSSNDVVSDSEPQWLVRNWQTEDGLPDNTITAIQQTSEGYLWLGTFNGLVRFDGVQFRTYDAANTPQLRISCIHSLLADSKGTLWIGTEGAGLVRMTNGVFEAVPLGDFGDTCSVPALFEGRDGALWVLVEGKGVARWRTYKLDTFSEAELRSEERLQAISDDAGARAWLGGRNNLLTFRGGSWFSRPSQVPTSDPQVVAVQRSRNGVAWAAYPRRLAPLEPGRAPSLPGARPWGSDFSSALVTKLIEDRTGRLWVGTLNNGLYCSTKAGDYRPVQREGPLPQSLISTVYEDQQGLIWVGTYRSGLFRIKPRTVVTLVPPGTGEVNVQTCCAAADGTLWLGTGGAGLFQFAEGKFRRFGEADGLANLHVCTVFEDHHTNLWVGTWGGLFLRDGDHFRAAAPTHGIPERVLALYEDRAGDLWVGGYGGLARKHGRDWSVQTTADGLSHPDVRALAEDREGNLWVGTAGGGLDRYRDGRFAHFGAEAGFPQKMVIALHAETDGTLWVGTITGGLARYQMGRFTFFTTQDGLADNVIGSILEDGRGNLWLGSANGILCVNKEALRGYKAGAGAPLPCLSLSVGDGLATRQCSGSGQPVSARAADGRLWIPNMRAVAMVDPRRMQSQALAPSVLIEQVLIDGRSPVTRADHAVRMPSGRGRFEFHYTALGLTAPETARFRYKLEGLDRDWVDAGTRRQADYGQLPAGDYQFRVMATGSDGLWHEADRPLKLEIVPHLWELGWFQVLAGMALVAAVSSAVYANERRKLRRRLERLETLRALETERGRIARDIHDDLGASLTQIMLVSELGQSLARQPNEAELNFAKIARKTRQAVQSLDEIVWAVNPKNDNLPRLARYICRFADECFEASGIRCWHKVPDDLPQVPMRAELRHNLFLAVKEALNNVLKHSHAAEVWLRIAIAGETLRVEIEDNGRGFSVPAADAGRSGLRNMKTRLEEIGGSTEIQSAPQGRTCVCFSLPLNNTAVLDPHP
jgi:ligand-binding sensor domain-containing protein/signal transduction histidine kinase